MGKNKGQETVQMYRWNQYTEKWIPFTGSVDTKGRVKIISDSLPIEGNNPSLVLAYDGSDQLTTIEMTIGATTYTRTLTYTDGLLTSLSVWS